MSVYDKANELVTLGETRRYVDTKQLFAASGIADPNAALNPSAVGVPTNGAKSMLLGLCAEGAGGSGSARLWVYRGPRAAGGLGWVVPPGGDLGTVAELTGYIDRFDVSGVSRVYCEVVGGVGAGLSVVYGMGVLE